MLLLALFHPTIALPSEDTPVQDFIHRLLLLQQLLLLDQSEVVLVEDRVETVSQAINPSHEIVL